MISPATVTTATASPALVSGCAASSAADAVSAAEVVISMLPASRHAAGEPLHCGEADETQLKELITRHAEYTGSQTAKAILANWDAYREKFVKVYPHEYKRALTEMAAQPQKK